MKSEDYKLKLLKRLEKHPNIMARMEALLNIAENTSGSIEKADDAEEQLIAEINKMGNALLSEWAVGQEIKKSDEAKASNPQLIRHSKKNFVGQQHSEK